MGTSLCGMTLATRPPPPPSRGCFGAIKNQGRRLLMWGASQLQSLFYMFRWWALAACCSWPPPAAACRCPGTPQRMRRSGWRAALLDAQPTRLPPHSGRHIPPLPCLPAPRVIYLYGVVVLLMAAIHLGSPDYRYRDFPNECPPDKQWGCRCVQGLLPPLLLLLLGARHLRRAGWGHTFQP